MSKSKQVDLEQLIAKSREKSPQGELADAFTGELFQPKSRNHYEVPDPVPFAPPVALARPTIRQRIENLLNRDPGLIQRYIQERDDGSVDMDIPDDPEAPLTASELNYVDMVAAEIAEAAPLPDDGLPRPGGELQSSDASAQAPGAPGGGDPGASAASAPAGEAPAGRPPAAPSTSSR